MKRRLNSGNNEEDGHRTGRSGFLISIHGNIGASMPHEILR